MTHPRDRRISSPRRATSALCVLALASTAVACSAPQTPRTTTTVTVEKIDEGSADERSAPPPEPVALSALEPEQEEPTIVGDATGPARRVLETAEQMYEGSVVVRGSCYTYVDEVFERAGYGHRRAREAVFQGPRRGPYADLDLIEPGDWLYITTDPGSRPVGTHSVLFVRWEDRGAGRALVFSYVGGRAERPAHLMSRDVGSTYTVIRARERE